MKRVIKFNPIVLVVTVALLLSSCAKEEFVANKNQESTSSGGIWTNSATQCSSFTLIKPPVDFLFLWDNSSSQFLMNEQTKVALNNTLSRISERFDYRALMVPILGSDRHSNALLVAENPDGISGINVVSRDQAINSIGSFSTTGGSLEPGLTSARESLEYAINKNIFRRNAYTMVVLMSNGDDTGGYRGNEVVTHAIQKANKLLDAARILNPLQFRFMSMVPHGYKCAGVGNVHSSNGYIKASQIIHAEAGYPSNDGKTADSYDICGADFTRIFDGINNSIEDALIKHQYDYWPVIETSTPVVFNKDAIRVKKYAAGAMKVLQEGVHWDLVDNEGRVSTIDICAAPKAGVNTPECIENKTGYFIKLKGEGIVNYPECVIVETEDVLAHYGYIVLQAKPALSTVKVSINGREIAQSATNGWTYQGYSSKQNIRIQSETSHAQGYPADYKSGYVLRLNGNSVYGNNSTVEVKYLPASN